MFCNNCGAQIPEGSAFCLGCGIPVAPPNTKKKPKDASKKRGGFWTSLIAGFLIVALLCGVLALIGAASFGLDRYEGSGFSSGEDALLAFVDAMKNMDTEKMLSCFAIESYVSHFSFSDYYAWTDYAPLGNTVFLPENTAALHSYNEQVRLQEVATECAMPFICTANGCFENDLEGGYDLYPGTYYSTVQFYSDGSTEPQSSYGNYPQSLNNPRLRQVFSSMQVLGSVIDVTAAAEKYYSEKNSDRTSAILHRRIEEIDALQADDIRDYAVPVMIDGCRCYFSVQTVCYDGRWYVLSLASTHTISAHTAAGFSLGITGVGGDD